MTQKTRVYGESKIDADPTPVVDPKTPQRFYKIIFWMQGVTEGYETVIMNPALKDDIVKQVESAKPYDWIEVGMQSLQGAHVKLSRHLMMEYRVVEVNVL